MGEISDALRRARSERETGGPSLKPEAALPNRVERPLESPLQPAPDVPDAPEVTIDTSRSAHWEARAVVVHGERAVAERFRQLAVRIEQQLNDRSARALLVSSADRQEGKTLTSCNLALALASLGGTRRVALLDLDLRKPSVARSLGIAPRTGLEVALAGGASLDEVRITTNIGLDVYPVAHHCHNAHELLSSQAFDAMLQELVRRHSTVIIDSPPILPVPDVALIAPRIGTCLLVARAGSTRLRAMQDALRSLPAGCPIGVFLNEAPSRTKPDHYYGYGPVEEPPKDENLG
ncbi:MAG: CpsD/CapB family tyrosine-protein kinase [Myxococcota bacterium]|nr:CpsD/CapB family tyrosine-protein kinase [Myxococcota bacterium]